MQRTGNLKSIVEVFGSDAVQGLRAQITSARTATFRPLALAGFTVAPAKRFSFDLDVTRSGIAYTPVAAKLGVIEERIGSGLNFFFTPRTELRLDYYYGHYSAERFDHFDLSNVKIVRLPVAFVGVPLSACFLVTGQLRTENKADHDQSHGGSAVFNRKFIRSERLSFDAGYSGLAYGFAGQRRKVFMGFFNPSFYQRHLVTTRLYGQLWRPVGYDFAGGVGLQQVEQGHALTRAVILSPALTLKASHHLSLTVGYTYYNTAETLGRLRGNAVRASTDWKF
jgi:hypothetical protein